MIKYFETLHLIKSAQIVAISIDNCINILAC